MNYTGNIKRCHASHGMFNELGHEPEEAAESGEKRGSYDRKSDVRTRIRDCGVYIAVFAEMQDGSWRRIAYCPTSVKALQDYFSVTGINWTIPPPGKDIHIDMLIWSWAGKSDHPRCSLDDDGNLQVDSWSVDAYLDVSQDLPDPFHSEVGRCG